MYWGRMMKEPLMITCPFCGKDTPEGGVCRNCGKEISLAQGMEVYYKDFKGSEMLDIKMSGHARREDQKTSQKGTEAADSAPRSEKKLAGKKTIIILTAGVVIILLSLAWYYLLKFFMKF